MYTVLVDANNLTARINHKQWKLQTSDGVPTGILYGVLRWVRRFYLDYNSTYPIERVILVFDSHRPVFRKNLYPEYKVNRNRDFKEAKLQESGKLTEKRKKKLDKDEYIYKRYRLQLNLLWERFPALGFVCVRTPDFEADDTIYRIIREYKSKFIVYSNDRDFVQLAGKSNVTIIQPRQTGDVIIDEAEPYALIRKIMEGDTSDNIKGVPQIGPKRAIEIAEEIGEGRFSDFLDHLERSEKYGERLEENREILLRNFGLISLPFSYRYCRKNEMEIASRKFSHRQFTKVCLKYDLRSIFLESKNFTRILSKLHTDMPKRRAVL